MSLYHYAQPTATQQFSDNTERHKTMAGASLWPKRVRCYCCEKMRNSETAIQTTYGFVCDYCARGKK